jgi:hypothetical protein
MWLVVVRMGYYINQNGENYGPYTIGQLRSMWRAGQLTGDTLYCEVGYSEWLRLSVLAEELDAREQSPRPLPAVRGGIRKPLVVAGVASGVLVVICTLAGVLSPSVKPPRKAVADSEAVTEEYARRINTFAGKWDMTVEDVMRWDYVFTRRGLTLADYDQALAKLDRSSDIALGYHPNRPKRNANGRRLAVGETKFPQNPGLSEDEENAVKLLKVAGY